MNWELGTQKVDEDEPLTSDNRLLSSAYGAILTWKPNDSSLSQRYVPAGGKMTFVKQNSRLMG